MASCGAALGRIHRAGIAVLGAFVFGMDSDTQEKLHRRTRYMIRSGVDVMQATLLTPLQGSRLFDRLLAERRLLFTDWPGDWDHYDMTEVVYRPGRMEPAALSQLIHQCSRRMYGRPALWLNSVKPLLATRSLTATAFSRQSNVNYGRVAWDRP